ncbi:MAG: DUF3098 domain-containing protein [Bacteroidetes bacterium]|nr:DUF3098 domain-containing protein [Bacteroidota bacterium]
MASSSSRPRRSRSADSAAPTATARTRRPAPDGQPVFTSRNYTLLGVALALIVVGYTLMRVENEVDGTLSLFVSPLLLLAGYLGVIYAILWRPRRTAADAPAVAMDAGVDA